MRQSIKHVTYLFLALAATGCTTAKHETTAPLRIPRVSAAVQVDGRLNEACYREHAPLTAFVVAAEPARKAPPTKAWLFWDKERLVCAFECADSTQAWAPPVPNERDVDGQDRCELFLWTGDARDAYYCIEAAPGGAIHDYQARFYRKFDDAWSPGEDGTCRATRTSTGYVVEMVLTRRAVEAMGLKLETGARFQLGLFRADYDRYNGQPTWITWIDRGRAPADFHVAESFGTAELAD
jgi:hypothetical protein